MHKAYLILRLDRDNSYLPHHQVRAKRFLQPGKVKNIEKSVCSRGMQKWLKAERKTDKLRKTLWRFISLLLHKIMIGPPLEEFETCGVLMVTKTTV